MSKRFYSVLLAVMIALLAVSARPAAAQKSEPAVFGRGEIKSFSTLVDGKTLAINTTRGIWLHDLKDITTTPKLLATPTTAYESSFSKDGTLVAVATHANEFPVLEVESGKVLKTYKEEKEYYSVYSVALSPDGKTVAAGCTDEKIRVFDVESGDLTTTLEDGHTDYITELMFSADGKKLVSAGEDKLVIVWDLEKEDSLTLKGHTGGVDAIAFSPDGKTLASAGSDKSVRIWDLAKGKQSAELSSTDVSEDYSLAFSPDGKTLAVGTSYPYVVRLWDLAKNKKIADFKGHQASISGVAFSPDGKMIVSASSDNIVRTWDVGGADEKDVLAGIYSGVVRDYQTSPDGKTIAVISYYDKFVRIYNGDKTDIPAMLLEGGDSEMLAIAYSNDGKMIAGTSSSSIYLWDTEKGKLTSTIKLSGVYLTSLVFSADGKMIGWGASDGRAGIYTTATGKSLQMFNGHTQRIRKISFNADGTLFLTSSDDGTVRQWKVGK